MSESAAASAGGERLVAGWAAAAALGIGAVVALLAMFSQTVASTVDIWARSETFAHGFLVFPISAWLIWYYRHRAASAAPRPDMRALFLVAALGFGWLAAYAGGVLVIQQYAVVAMIPAAVWAVLGLGTVRAFAFPLAYLLLAVPVGEFLIYPLMGFTADFTVAALRLAGIPVYREGMFFTIPSGQWSVVEGCSGLRYLIASATLGLLYGYLTYRSLKRRILFAIASFVVPIIANGMRAFIIVMIGHLSDGKLAHGVDHFIYGWVFFGLVMLLLFWIGSYWREDRIEEERREATWLAPAVGTRTFAAAVVSVLVTVSIWPAYAIYLDNRVEDSGRVPAPEAPAPTGGWQTRPDGFTEWRPHWTGTDVSGEWFYEKDNRKVYLYLGYYRTQRQDAELINTQNYMIRQKHPVWQEVGRTTRELDLESARLTVNRHLLRSPGQRLLIWQWNRVRGEDIIDPYLLKLMLAKHKMLLEPDDGAAIVLATPYDGQPEEAERTLRDFLKAMRPAIGRSLDLLDGA
jgi:exosortase A